MFRTKVTISLLEVIIGLLQPLPPVLNLQIDLRLLKMVLNGFPYPKTPNTKHQNQVSSMLRS